MMKTVVSWLALTLSMGLGVLSAQVDCTGCAPSFALDSDTIDVSCGGAFTTPEIPNWNNPCELQVFESLSGLTGGVGEPNCGGVTAYGPGADFAIWLNGLTTLGFAPSDYFLTGTTPLGVQHLPSGDIVVTGLVINELDPALMLEVNVLLDHNLDWQTWSAGGGLAKDPLGTNNFESWDYLLLNSLGSTLTGLPGTPTADWSFTLAHNPSSEIYGFQVGMGANTHNANNGLGGWFAWSMTIDGEAYASVGDLIVDLTSCTPTEWPACQGEDLVYEFVISNDCGADTATVVVQFTDSQPPIFLNCQDTDPILCQDPLPSFSPVVIDNCSGFELSLDTAFIPGSCGPGGQWIRTYTATDSCGNVGICEVTTPVEELDNLIFYGMPAGGTIECSDWAECETFPLPIAISGCAGDTAEVSCEVIYLDCDSMPSVFDALLAYHALDSCGNALSDTISIHVTDNEPPYFTFIPPDETMTLEEFLNWSLEIPICYDTCFVPNLDCETGWGGPGSPVGPVGGPLLPLPCEYDSTYTPLCCGGFEIVYDFSHFDLAGNEATAQVTITVVDVTPPEFASFPPDTALACSQWDDLASFGDQIEITDDSCDPDSLFISHVDSISAGNCAGNFTLFRTFTAQDNCGNAQDSLWTVQFVDTVPPLFWMVPEDLQLFCGDSIPLDTAFAADACGSVMLYDTLMLTDYDGEDCLVNAVYEHWWYAQDDCGNIDSISRHITVLDTLGPHFLFVQDSATVECVDWLGCGTFPLPTALAGGCNGDSLDVNCTVNYTNCALYPAQFTAWLIYDAENDCGDSIMDSTFVSVIDTTAPYFEWVPPDTTLTLEAFENWTVELPVCVDDCYYPDVICGEFIPGAGAGGGGMLPCEYDSTITDLCCGGFEIVYLFYHEDLAGNTASVEVTVSVIDVTPPEFASFPADTLLSCAQLDLLNVPGYGIDLTDDSCPPDSLFLSHVDSIAPGFCAGDYFLYRTFSAADNCGNVVDSIWTVQVIDTLPPHFVQIPEDTNIFCGFPIPLDTALAIDSCGSTMISDTLIQVEYSGDDCSVYSVYERWWFAQDDCGNQDSVYQTITVLDTLGPHFVTVPDSLSLACTEWMGCESQPIPIAIAGGCNGDTLVVECNVSYVNCDLYPAQFTASFIYTAENDCGDVITDSTWVTVSDTTAPYFQWVPPDTTLTLVEYEDWTVELPICMDDCYFPELDCGEAMPNGEDGILPCEYDSTVSALCCGGFEIVYVFHSEDLAGNEASTEVTVSVVDVTPPEFVDFPADTVMSCGTEGALNLGGDTLVSYVDDSCLPEEIQLTHVDSVLDLCAYTYILQRTFTATDGCGNAHSQTWTVEVVDTLSPTFQTVPEDLILACTDTLPVCDLSEYLASDVCSEVELWCDGDSIVPGECPQNYDILRRVGATDSCGNVAYHVQLIEVRDTVQPIWLSVPMDTLISCDAPLPPVDLTLFDAEDNCSDESELVYSLLNEIDAGDICVNEVTREFEVQDACGNAIQYGQIITIVDTTGPVFSEILEPDSFLCGDLVPNCFDTNIFWTDNCNDATWTCSDSVLTGDCTLNECLIERTFVLTDACDNASSMVQMITVSETEVDAELPTGISPNGDLINDAFVILNIDPEAGILPCAWGQTNEIVIFNRWGNEVYRETNYRNDWQGVNQSGEPLPEGTYFVVFTSEGKTYSTYVDLRR